MENYTAIKSNRCSTKLLSTAISAILSISALAVSASHASHYGTGKDKMEKLDTDGNGSVSKEEFMSYQPMKHEEEYFNKKDANGDGMLTENEMRNRCKHKGYRKAERRVSCLH